MNIQFILLIVLVVVLFIIWWWNRRGDDKPENEPYHASPFAGKAADTAPTHESHTSHATPAPAEPAAGGPPESDPEPLPILIPLEKVELPEPAGVAPAPVTPVAAPAQPEPSSPQPETVAAPPPVESVPAVEPVAPVEMPGLAKAAPPPAADDLEVIEGIGPKISGVLKAAGITTFAQLAALKPDAIKQIITDGGVKIGDPTTWPQQAKLAAEGKWDKLKTLQDKLQGGRKS